MRLWILLPVLVFASSITSRAQIPTSTETLLFIRHGEKGPMGLGQLNCKGLNRSLALPAVLKRKYGHIDAIFAPDPSHAKMDGLSSYDYVRPLATVEATAVVFGLPVHAAIGYEETVKLRAALVVPEFRAATVLVAWEHHAMNDIVPALVAERGGDAVAVPKWGQGDFDSIWRVTIIWTGGTSKASFEREAQGLDGQSDLCLNTVTPAEPHVR